VVLLVFFILVCIFLFLIKIGDVLVVNVWELD
jgi:hypothetical protein